MCILVAIALANMPAILHLVTSNPLHLDAYLRSPQNGLLPGLPYIDPNAGYTAQALGHLSAVDWLHGHVPWWNPFEGIGAPLAGEMQSGAFFPLTVLLLFHDGTLYLQLLLETIAGWSTYALVRRLGVGRCISSAAGVAFALCGTFAWFAHAPVRPIAFLPLCLIGIDRAIEAAREQRTGGWQLLAMALALSILAGFPETTFINGLFVLWWAILRLSGPARVVWKPAVGKLVLGFAVGIALAAPLIIAFVDYLGNANTGSHGEGFANVSLPRAGLAQLVLPYGLGPIFGLSSGHGIDTIQSLWASTGGFLSATLIAGGIVGLIGRRERGLRLGLAAWVALFLMRTFGVPAVLHLFALAPGTRLIAFFRYADPSWEFAVVALAALGLDDIARSATRRRVLVSSAALTGLVVVWAAASAWPVVRNAIVNPAGLTTRPWVYLIGSLAFAVGALVCLALGGWWAGLSPSDSFLRSPTVTRIERIRRRGRVVMAGVVMGESVMLLGFTYLSAPTPRSLQLGSVKWLQTHLGTYRFITLGPIQPDYGSYFGIAQANVNDLPLPETYNTYIHAHLDPNSPQGVFTGGARIDPSKLTPAEELNVNLANYEALGIRYVVEKSTGSDLQGRAYPAAGSPPWPAGPRRVYRDQFAEVWELPSALSLYSIKADISTVKADGSAPSCIVAGSGWNYVTVRCPAPSTVTRRVQYIPGWTARANGQPILVQKSQGGTTGLFQELTVPPGMTVIRFAYVPPYEAAGALVAGTALIILFASIVVPAIRNQRRSRNTGVARSE
jgi:hypothetical protein